MGDITSREIRGLMVPVTGTRVLLPNATVAEVITYSAPEKIPNAPAWLLGRLSWRGWRLPLFSFSILSGSAGSETVSNAKVAVLKALSGNAKMPFVAMLAQGFPRLTTITPDLLIPTGNDRYRIAEPIRNVLNPSLRGSSSKAALKFVGVVPAAKSPVRTAIERQYNDGREIVGTLEPNELRSGDLVYTGEGSAVVVRRTSSGITRRSLAAGGCWVCERRPIGLRSQLRSIT